MPDTGAGTPPGRQTLVLAQAARAKASRLTGWLALNWFATRVVNEFIVAFLGTLPLDRRPESKPFTPLSARVRASAQGNACGRRVHPGSVYGA